MGNVKNNSSTKRFTVFALLFQRYLNDNLVSDLKKQLYKNMINARFQGIIIELKSPPNGLKYNIMSECIKNPMITALFCVF